MTITQLEYFCALCRLRSVTRAAEELCVSQPTISIAIRNLEKELHVRLLHHGKNTVSLTEEGEQFYRKASDIVRRTQDLKSEFSELGESALPLRLGIPPLISTVFFPMMLEEFHKKSDIPVHLYEYGSDRARNLVNSGELDLAMVNMDFYNIDQFESQMLMSDRFVYCVAKNHPMASRSSVTIEDLADEKIILFNTDSVQNEQVLSRFHSRNLNANVIMHISQLKTIENVIESGQCGVFLFSSIDLDPEKFVKIELTPMIASNFGLIWKKGTYISRRAEKFIRFARSFDIMKY